MSGLIFSLILLIFPILVKSCFNEKDIEVITSLLRPLNIKNCILVETECDFLRIGIKLFSKKNIYTVYNTFDQLVQYLKIKNLYYQSQKMIIVLKMEDEIKMKYVLETFNKKISYLDSFSKFKWIMLLPKAAKMIKSVDFHVPFSCQFFLLQENEFSYKINEIYQIKNQSEMIYTSLGYVDNAEDIKEKDFYSRRNNFRRENMLMRTRSVMAYTDLTEVIQLELWHDLEKMFNFTTTYVEENHFDVATMKEDIRIDISILHFLNAKSQDVIAPFLIAKWHLYIRASEDILESWLAYLKPFSSKLWYAVIGWLIISSLLTTFIGWIGLTVLKLQGYTLYEQAMTPLSAFCSQASYPQPTTVSSRVARIFAYATSNVIVPAYSAAVISFLMVYVPKIPFRDLDSFVQDGTYQLASLKKLFAKMYFQYTERRAERIIWDNYLLSYDDFPATHEKAIEMVCTSHKISVMNFNYRMFQYPASCHILKVSKPIVNLITGPRLYNYGVHYVKIFRDALVIFHTGGMMDRWHNIYYGKKEPEGENNPAAIDITKTAPLIIVLIVGVSFSCFLLILEILYSHVKNFRHKKTFSVTETDEMLSHSEGYTLLYDKKNYLKARKSAIVEYFP